ncbi:WXG100 family type VII secretion target [Kutzneria sp. NPDC052558]|uniref:WXG100 family type VII secretion target n=1 Tax=Kutzneria sp. NPDC052558 TaxID=3364121 RepID=UPI0037CCB1DE
MWPFDREVPGDAHAAFDHKTIYTQLHNGTGPSSLSTAVAGWQSKISSQFDDAHQLITSGLRTASATWEGSAADAMHGDVAPMAQFVLNAKDVSHTIGQSTQSQADHFADVKNKMPPPVEVTATDSWLSRGWSHLTGGQTDAEAQEQQALHASDAAAAVYADYNNNSTTATTTMSAYPAVPQSNGIDAAPPQQPGGPVPYKVEQPGPVGRGSSNPLQPQDFRGQQPIPPLGHDAPPVDTLPPTTIQHVPVGGPPTPGPPGGFLPVTDPVRPPVGTPPINPIGFYGPPGGGGGPDGYGSTSGGRGGSSSGFGARGGAGAGGTGNVAGRGGSAGAGPLEEAGPGGRPTAGTAGRPGTAGSPGMGGPACRGKGKGEEDQEHLNKFMEPTDEHWGTGEKTVPPVIGDPDYQP